MGAPFGHAVVGYPSCPKCLGAGEVAGLSCARCDRKYRHAIETAAKALRSVTENSDTPLSDIMQDLQEQV